MGSFKTKQGMSKAIMFISTLIALTAFTIADKPTLDEIQGKSYHPIIPGQKLIYKADLSTYSKTFDTTTIELSGKTYIKCTTDYGTSQSIAFYREEGNRVLYIKPNQISETVQIPENPTIGMVWYESDSTWKYTVTSVVETIETPDTKYINCLVIQSENVNRKANPDHYEFYMQYYQRGRGYIGTKLGGLLYSYVTNDK